VVDAFGYENKELHEGFGIGAKKHAGIKKKEMKAAGYS
jgi:hypothetical protein